MKPTIVYTLASSRDGEVRYVGQTVQKLCDRRRQHICDANRRRSTAVQKWIARELAAGFQILIQPAIADAVLHRTEIEMIAKYRAEGYRLLNLTDGGEGTLGRRGNTGNRRPDLAERNRRNKGRPGHAISAESKAKISAANRGKKKPFLSERNREAIGKPGRPHTAESRANISAATKGRVFSLEHRRKISESAKGRKLNAEQVAALRAGHRRYYEARRA